MCGEVVRLTQICLYILYKCTRASHVELLLCLGKSVVQKIHVTLFIV